MAGYDSLTEPYTEAVLFQFSRYPQLITIGDALNFAVDLQFIYSTILCELHCKVTIFFDISVTQHQCNPLRPGA